MKSFLCEQMLVKHLSPIACGLFDGRSLDMDMNMVCCRGKHATRGGATQLVLRETIDGGIRRYCEVKAHAMLPYVSTNMQKNKLAIFEQL